jgi:hypothetical protein
MPLLITLFKWPNGIVVGNLIASAICVLIAAIHLDRLANRHHKEHMAHWKGVMNLMPYEIKPSNSGYDVVNKDTQEVKAHHATKEDAERQVRLLHAVESNPEWEKDNG